MYISAPIIRIGLKISRKVLRNGKNTANPLTNHEQCVIIIKLNIAGWSNPVARRAHNPKVGGSNPPPATIKILQHHRFWRIFLVAEAEMSTDFEGYEPAGE